MDQFSRSTGAVQTRFISCQLACHPTATPASSWRWSTGFRGLAGLVESQKHRPSPGRPGGLPGQQRSGRDREPKEPKHGVVVEVDGGAEGDRREMVRDAQADLRKRERPQCRDRGNGGGWQSRGFVMRGKACDGVRGRAARCLLQHVEAMQDVDRVRCLGGIILEEALAAKKNKKGSVLQNRATATAAAIARLCVINGCACAASRRFLAA